MRLWHQLTSQILDYMGLKSSQAGARIRRPSPSRSGSHSPEQVRLRHELQGPL